MSWPFWTSVTGRRGSRLIVRTTQSSRLAAPRRHGPRAGLSRAPRRELARALLGLIHAMRGIITGRDVVQNVGIIYREFGPRCLARLLWVLMVGKRTTFLEVISQH